MENPRPRRGIKLKIFGIVILSVFIISAALGYISFQFSKNRLISMLGDSIKGVAATTASFIRQDDIDLIVSNMETIKTKHMAQVSKPFASVYERQSGLYPRRLDEAPTDIKKESPDETVKIYDRYVELLSDIKKLNKIDGPVNVYASEGKRLSMVMTSDQVVTAGASYIMRPEAANALSMNLAVSTPVYKDKDGIWISAYAPVPNYGIGGRSVVEVNYKVDLYARRLREELAIIIIVCLIGFLATAIISYKLTTTLVAAIRRLDEIAHELEQEHYDTPIDIKSDDEVGHLADTFEGLRVSIMEKIEELKLSLVREKRAHLESIVALTNAIEMRDPYTRHHLKRVEEFALLIAKAMHLSHSDVEKLRYSCFLHDIGKIYVESAMLQKIKFSPEDFKEIKKHSERGAKIIEGIQFLSGVKEAVLHHQERYDGKGYPDGLKGEEIPFLARIVSVADAFDAMTTDRPYKPKMSFKEAMKEVERNSGTQFDPKVCEAFLKYRDEIENIAKKHFDYPSE